MPAEEPTRIMLAVSETTILKKHGVTHIPASLSSRFAFEWVTKRLILSNCAGFKLILFNVRVAPELATSERQQPTAEDEAKAMEMLKFLISKCREIGLACEVLIGKGDPAKVICREAKRVRPDLLVVGSRGFGPYLRIFFKSVSFSVQENLGDFCPLAVIKRPQSLTPYYSVSD